MRHDISLRSLRLFLRVAATRSFSETARLENVSQPALSRTVRLLEEQLGVRLFDRDTRNVALTTAGAQLRGTAERLLADYDLAFAGLEQSFLGERGCVSIGALPSVAAAVLPPVLARFRAERPEVDVRVLDDLSDPLLQMLEDRTIDVAVTIAPEATDRLAFQPLLSDEFVLVCPKGDALAEEPVVAWASLASARFIAMAPRSSVRRETDAAFVQAGAQVRPLYECAHLSTVGGFLRAGLGVSALPRSTLPLLGADEVAVRPLRRPHAFRTIGILRLRARTTSPAAESLIAVMQAMQSAGAA